MSFMLTCPMCGKRQVSEFTFRGEYDRRPSPDDGMDRWTDYVFFKKNTRGRQIEWWYHQSGCRRWFLVARDTTDNTEHVSFLFDDRARYVSAQELK